MTDWGVVTVGPFRNRAAEVKQGRIGDLRYRILVHDGDSTMPPSRNAMPPMPRRLSATLGALGNHRIAQGPDLLDLDLDDIAGLEQDRRLAQEARRLPAFPSR